MIRLAANIVNNKLNAKYFFKALEQNHNGKLRNVLVVSMFKKNIKSNLFFNLNRLPAKSIRIMWHNYTNKKIYYKKNIK